MQDAEASHLDGCLPDGRRVRRIEIASPELSATILDLGSILQDLRRPDVPFGLTLGATDAAAYGRIMNHFGAVMGPVANRISNARAEIAGQSHHFPANQDGTHTLHGGDVGLHLKTWDVVETGPDHVTLALDLPDGEGGFPGRRRITSTYRIEGDTLIHELTATTDAETLINLAHHGYFTTQPPTTWGGQRLWVFADRYLPTIPGDLPAGQIAPVDGTDYDFRDGPRLDPETTPELDHNFCLADAPRDLTPVLRLSSEATGVAMELSTTAPGLQVFGMHKFAVEDEATVHGHDYPKHGALALEPQLWPDAPGREGWPSIALSPDETFRQTSTYRFTTA